MCAVVKRIGITSGLLSSLTWDIVCYSKEHNVSETESVSVLR
jgi:hypothetical protein